jgi:hypothetical protein
MTPAWTSFLIGLTIGGGASLFGAVLSYWFGLRDQTPQSGAPLAYLFLVPVVLSFIGALALVAAFFNDRSIGLILLTGLGVILGFTLVFALLLFLWVQQDSTA